MEIYCFSLSDNYEYFFLILSVLRLDKWQFLKGQLQCGIENLSMNFFTLLL